MSKKETTNTFSEGMVKDLNPINTPNTVLTDCLNGTMITYDGNELSLQNDKGNYPLKNCKLKQNYVPVGLKEYGDILYIISYNPINEHVEIGSYPSPKTITELNSNDFNKNIISIKQQILNEVDTQIPFERIVNEMEKPIVFYGNGDPENCKLNPGDEYQLNIINSNDSSKYETLDFFILDENRQLYNINKYIKTTINDNFKNIEWNVPGWFGIKPRFASIKDFKINIIKAVMPAYSNKITLKIGIQIIVDDPLFINNPLELAKDLKLDIKTTLDKVATTIPEETITSLKFQDLKNGTGIFYCDYTFIQDEVLSNSNINIKVFPKIIIDNKEIVYTSFTKELNFNTNDKEKTIKTLSIGDNAWWYNIDNIDHKLILKFDTSGISENTILDEDLYLFYSISHLNNSNEEVPVVTNSDKPYTDCILDEWHMTGETIKEFDLETFSEENYTKYPNRLYAEDIYIMRFYIYNNPNKNGSAIKTFSKTIIASELFNNFSEQRFDLIPFDKWIGEYKNSIKNGNFIINNSDFKLNSDLNSNCEPSYSNGFSAWKHGTPALNTYNCFIPDTIYDDSMKDGFLISAEVSGKSNITYNNNLKVLTGPLWLNFNENCFITQKLKTINNCKLNKFTGLIKNENIIDSLDVSIKREQKYSFKNLFGFDNTSSVWNYKTYPLRISATDLFKMTGFADTDGNKNGNVISITGTNLNSQKFNEPNNTFNYNSYLNKIDNNNKSGTYDILSLGIRLGLTSSNKYEFVQLDNESGSPFDKIVGNETNKYTGYTYFYVFKINNNLFFTKVSDQLLLQINKVSHLISDNTTLKLGSFYNALSDETINVKNTSYKIEGNLIPNGFVYNNIDLLSETGRTSIKNLLPNNNNFSISDSEKGSEVLINTITLPTLNGEIDINKYLLKINESGENIDTYLNNIIKKGSIEVDLLNKKVFNNYQRYTEDWVFKNNNSLQDKNELSSVTNYYFYEKTPTAEPDDLINLLNGNSQNLDTSNLRIYSGGVHYSEWKNVTVIIGNYTYLSVLNK